MRGVSRFICTKGLIYTKGGSGHVCKDTRQLKESHKKEVRRCMASVPHFLATVEMQMLINLTPFNWREKGSYV